jgi:hypothetical protein
VDRVPCKPVSGRSRLWTRCVSVVLAGLGAILATPIATGGQSATDWVPPPTLRDTGLYSDWATKTVAADNLPFSPQYPLWSDGAKKLRWIHIPKGTFIDGSNPDVWKFPVGMRLWKEFRFDRRVETRLIELTRDGWHFVAYRWNADETDAPLVSERGVLRAALIRDGIYHTIPSRTDCLACHQAGPVRLLGVTTLQLSSDRDPNAPHAEAPPLGAVDLTTLVARGLVRGLPAYVTEVPPRIAATTPTARAALGYLNANCGGCHTGLGDLSSLSFALNYTLNRPPGVAPPALLTAVGQPSRFRVPGVPEAVERVSAGHPDLSVVVQRMSSRHPLVQMPPLGTRIVDDEAVNLVRRWIADDLGPAEPSPATNEQHR